MPTWGWIVIGIGVGCFAVYTVAATVLTLKLWSSFRDMFNRQW